MKTANAGLKNGFFGAVALLCLTLAASVGAQVTGFSTYCDLRLTGCPQDYDEKALTVPLDVVSLSTKVRACGRSDAVEMVEGPAVMFIIDHSTSMDQNGVDNDANGNRFRVTRALIDSIYERAPNAEIGLVLFANGLVFNVNRDANLVKFEGTINPKAPPALANQAYMPLMQLNQPAKPRGGTSPFSNAANPNAIDVYRAMFTVPPPTATNPTPKSSITGGPITQSGTDISIAFEAALEAFKNTSKAKDNQYIIFLSDGEPGINTGVGGGGIDSVGCRDATGTPSQYNPRCALLNSFTAGTNYPPTYTVYLQKNPTTVPPLIATMTDNVKKNGYSPNNVNSNAWALEANYTALLTLMMDEIVSKMFKQSEAKAKTIVISSAGVKDTTGEMNGEFNFKRQLPMDTAAVTNVSMYIRYDVRIDSTLKDGRDTSWIVPDSLFTYDFTVRRSANPGANWNKDENGDVILDEECKTRVLDLQYDGATLVGKEVKDYMGKLDIVFSDESNPGNVKIEVKNAIGETLDLETFTLSIKNGKWTYSFPREISASATPGDNKLQHTGQDSIILVYRNPAVPLDTIRVAVPFSSNSMVFYDKDGKLLPDPDTVKAGYSLDIYANILNEFGDVDADMIKSGKVTWTIDGLPRVVLASDTGTGANHSVFRSETAGGSYLITATYTNGPMKIEKTIKVVVVPGDPKYIEAVTDSAKINYGQVKDTNYLKNGKEYEFRNGVVQATFYAVIRDAYGNFISMASGADWNVDQPEPLISADPRGDLSYALISRQGSKSSDFLYVIVSKTVKRDGAADTTITDEVHIVIAGVKSAAVGPNPFVPGSSPVMERLRQLDISGRLETLYHPIVANSKSGGGNGNAENANGILVVAEAHRQVKKGGESGDIKYAMAKAVIYDAVGHIVFESKLEDIILAVPKDKQESSTFGFVWNGKNKAGRTVGPGTYAMRMTATLTNGEKYAVQQMIGVTVNW